MPWKAVGMLEERVRFVVSAETGHAPMSALCLSFGISRQTGYKWLKRWREGGAAALSDASRVAHVRPHAVSAAVAEALVGLRQARPFWGPRKLLAVLRAARPEVAWPAASTAGDVLRRAGLVEARPRGRRGTAQAASPFVEAVLPNDEWAIDFKGWFRTADGKRCDPLTVSDTASRMLLDCRIMAPRLAPVAAACDRLFREHGLPLRMRMDNGPPFGSSGAAGLTRLSVGWLKLGIGIGLIEPGCPGQNGRHERMHGTLQRETARVPAADAGAQQARFDAFREDYNEKRPHEALGQVAPARVWRASARRHPGRVDEVWYGADHDVRRVRNNGHLRWRGEEVYVGSALGGEPVGLLGLPSGDWLVRFMSVDLGVLDRRGKAFLPYAAARPGRRVGQEQNGEIVSDAPGPKCQ